MARKPSTSAAKKPAGKKLTLSRETVRDLAAGKDVKGGANDTNLSGKYRCYTATC